MSDDKAVLATAPAEPPPLELLRRIDDLCEAIFIRGDTQYIVGQIREVVAEAIKAATPSKVLSGPSQEDADGSVAAPPTAPAEPPKDGEVAALRQMLAVAYAGALLYHDDGELQDNKEIPFIDFKRDSVEEIEAKMLQRTAKAWERLKAEQSAVAALIERLREKSSHEVQMGGRPSVATLMRMAADALARLSAPVPDTDVTDYTKCECCALSYEQGHRDGYQAGYTQGMNDRGNPN